MALSNKAILEKINSVKSDINTQRPFSAHKSLREHLEAVGHAKAYDRIYALMERDISEEDILDLQWKVLFDKISPCLPAGRFAPLGIEPQRFCQRGE